MTSTATRRRRQVFRGGLAAIVLISVAFGSAACIFDQGGTYQGGGRIGRAATAQNEKVKQEEGASSSSGSSGDPLTDDDDDTPNPSGIIDAGGIPPG